MRPWMGAALALALLCAGCARQQPAQPTPPREEPAPEQIPAPPPAAPETEDHVLRTLTTQVDGGRSLTLEIVGKMRTDMDQWGVREIRVYEGARLFQTLSVQEAIDTDGVSGALGAGYTDCRDPEGGLGLADMNFDGIADLSLAAWIPAGGNLPSYYWLWDSDSGAFRYGFCLPNAVVDEENRQIICSLTETAGYTTEYYEYDGGGRLELTYTVSETYLPDGTLRREAWRRVDGQLVQEE